MNKTEWQVYKRMPQDEFERVGHEIEKLLDKENVNCIDGMDILLSILTMMVMKLKAAGMNIELVNLIGMDEDAEELRKFVKEYCERKSNEA